MRRNIQYDVQDNTIMQRKNTIRRTRKHENCICLQQSPQIAFHTQGKKMCLFDGLFFLYFFSVRNFGGLGTPRLWLSLLSVVTNGYLVICCFERKKNDNALISVMSEHLLAAAYTIYGTDPMSEKNGSEFNCTK